MAVKDGVATLSGHLDTFASKHAASRALRRVAGVQVIALKPSFERLVARSTVLVGFITSAASAINEICSYSKVHGTPVVSG